MSRELEGEVRDVASGGDGVVSTSRGVVMVPGAWRGDHVRVRLVRGRGSVLRGQLVAVLKPSDERQEAPCTFSKRCGGCPWMIGKTDAQHTLKRERIERAIGREVSLVTAASEGVRRRARLSFDRGRLGYFERRSKKIVDIDHCLMLEPLLSDALTLVRNKLRPLLVGAGELLLSRGQEEGEAGAVLVLRADEPQPPKVYACCEELTTDGFAGVALAIEDAPPALFGDPREASVANDGRVLWGTVGGFSQANDAINAALVTTVVEFAKTSGQSVLELYAGHGNLTVALAKDTTDYVAVELDRDASNASRANVEARGLSVRVVAGSADHPPRGRFDVVVLDPPREGAKRAVPAILKASPERIVYVSCNTATLARDLRALSGYEVVDARGFDMFPHTAHVETVVALRRC